MRLRLSLLPAGAAIALTAMLATAQIPGVDAVFDFLRHERSSAAWDTTSSVVADFDGDGRADVAALGMEGDELLVAVATQPAGRYMYVQYLTFGVGRKDQAAVCTLPVRLQIQPADCKSEEQSLPGCQDNPDASSLTLVDGECDSIHMYWNHDVGSMAWWRR